MNKRSMCQSFSEEVAKLVLGVDLHKSDALRRVGNFLTKPLVLDHIVFVMGSHAARLHATKGQGTNIIFMHFAMDVGDKRIVKADSSTEFTDERNKTKEVFTSHTEGKIFCLHGGEGNIHLEMQASENRAAKSKDDITCVTAGAMGVL